MTEFRAFDPVRDGDAAFRIWQEVGWVSSAEKRAFVDRYFAANDLLVSDIDGSAECLALTGPGDLRYLDETLSLLCITGVTTSRIARKLGYASRLLASALAKGVDAGMKVTELGMFEQGFYNRLGYGTGCYETLISFDPNQLTVGNPTRPPRRLSKDDFAEVHTTRMNRLRRHGSVNLHHPDMTWAEMEDTENGFGLGYADGEDGELTHYFWVSPGDVGHGPYTISWLAYRNWTEFLELLSLIKALGEQVRGVKMTEPAGIQMQDFLKQPFLYRQLTEKGRYESNCRTRAYWQLRMLDLEGCLLQTHLKSGTSRFNLKLSDPIEPLLPEASKWRGCAGDYVVTLGKESYAEKGTDSALPTLTASIGAFTRLWLGVLPASGLAVSDDLYGSPELLEELDWLLRLPLPRQDWDF
ncbi:MAG: hypothetical protein H7308_08690 [Chthonomonadaceae bacterium]|nr:hypothetical protein [Chthonomonadaceae bacterium]